MSTIILQPDGAVGLDNWMGLENPTGNYGTDADLYIGEYDAVYRTLIKFSGLSNGTIPSTAIVSSAILSLYALTDFSSNARTFRVFRQLRAWVETESTWNIWSTGNNWQTAGGFGVADCEQTDIGSRAFTATETLNEFKAFPLTASKIQEIIAGTFTNNGFLMKTDTEADDMYKFASSDNATAANRPKLTVVYTTPATAMQVIII